MSKKNINIKISVDPGSRVIGIDFGGSATLGNESRHYVAGKLLAVRLVEATASSLGASVFKPEKWWLCTSGCSTKHQADFARRLEVALGKRFCLYGHQGLGDIYCEVVETKLKGWPIGHYIQAMSPVFRK